MNLPMKERSGRLKFVKCGSYSNTKFKCPRQPVKKNKCRSDARLGRHEGKPSRWHLSIRKTYRTNSNYRADRRMPQDGIER